MADNNGGANLAWFLVGAALGATAALLLAPQTGTETRDYLRRRTEDGRGRLAESGREAMEKGREYYDRGEFRTEFRIGNFPINDYASIGTATAPSEPN